MWVKLISDLLNLDFKNFRSFWFELIPSLGQFWIQVVLGLRLGFFKSGHYKFRSFWILITLGSSHFEITCLSTFKFGCFGLDCFMLRSTWVRSIHVKVRQIHVIDFLWSQYIGSGLVSGWLSQILGLDQTRRVYILYPLYQQSK